MTRNQNKPICFFVPADMYTNIRQVAMGREVSVSQLLRTLLRDFLRSDKPERPKMEAASPNDINKVNTSACASVSDGS